LALLSEHVLVKCWPVSIDVKFDRSLLIASSKGHIAEISPDKGFKIIIDEPTDEIYDFCIDQENLCLIITSADFTIRKWDLKENKLMRTPKKLPSAITAIDI